MKTLTKAAPITFPHSAYNHYPNTAIQLCIASYTLFSDIKSTVAAIKYNNIPSNLKVVWGPAQLVAISGISYSLMYIAKDMLTEEYFVVIRGTNPASMLAWLREDFSISNTQPFNSLPNILVGFPENVSISQAAYDGLSDLLSLTDNTTGETALEFLQSENPAYLYVTGHSLGGTLTPVMYTYLNWMLYDGVKVSNMALWSFAGLTAGGIDFNTHLNSIINDYVENNNVRSLPWRIQNNLDIAPFLFYAKNNIISIYKNFLPQSIRCPLEVTTALGILFDEASKAGIDYYEQPPGGVTIEGNFVPHLTWIEEAKLQHHSSTYQLLVASVFP